MFKKFLLVITTIVVLFSFVTYQPQKVDANGVTQITAFAAKKALQAATKSAVNDTVGSLALKVASKDLAEQYVKKEGLQLVVLEGGKKAMVKTTMTETQKIALKKEIDNVIDLKVYGNSPKWVKYLDWFVGVGAVVLVGQVLYATVTGDFSGFINEIFNEAMINLGWLTPAVQVGRNGEIPGKDPVSIPRDSPVAEPDHPTNPVPVPDYSRYVTYRSATSTGTTIPSVTLNVPSSEYVDVNGYVWSAEVQHDVVYPETGYPTPNGIFPNGSINVSPINFPRLRSSNVLEFGWGVSSFRGSFHVKDTFVTVKLGSTYLVNNEYVTSNLRSLSMPSTFDSSKYNKIISQNNYYDVNTRSLVSRFIMLNTSFNVPTLSVMSVKPFTGTTIIPDKNPLTRLRFDFWQTTSSISLNPVTIRLGIHTSLDMALDVPYLPQPNIGMGDMRVPIISPQSGKVAWPQKTILPDGYTYNPDSQTITDPAGNPVTDPATIPQKNPDPVIETSPDGNTVIDGVPTTNPAPDPVPGVNPVPPGGTNPPITTGDPKEINWAKLKAVPMILTKKFPFSLPWDAKRFMEGVFGEVPAAEEFSLKIDKLMGVDFNLNVTMPEYFDGWFAFSRTATVILFDIGLIYALYRLLGGAS